ncbi:flagellar biosynthetic protein FliQ [Alkalispirillum mobile]|uniref:Flagellar biosynthetic protein FliQ n=1 Tax=Alkalispirillum mobile TaxID=85925 RepID=A0A498C0X9_9GAMM|nr:flagellar biosynthesis protein FliQ [Alkalispirillum mobile]RLK48737.1 flagellar biosynthetic protein FliQ [Alkalispirillum mobile]
MTPELAIELGKQALTVAVLLAGPILLAALITGLLIGLFQAATQINEQTLSFVPKLGVMALVLFIMTPWMHTILTDFTEQLFRGIPGFIG